MLLEGGAALHGAWLHAGVVDRLEVYLGARSLAGGMPVSSGHGVAAIAEGHAWQLEQAPRLLGDTVVMKYRR